MEIHNKSRGVCGLDINPYPMCDFIDYKFSIQSNPRIGKIQDKSNPPICELVRGLKFFNYGKSTN